MALSGTFQGTSPLGERQSTPSSAQAAASDSNRSGTSDRRVRVLVVDDSFFMQKRIAEILQSVSDLRVVGFASNGAEAIQMAERLSPDVITMDINMSKFDGLHAIDYIMRSNPRPIVIISSYTTKGSRAAFHGLDMGVVDIVEKPSPSGISLDLADRAEEIITKVRTASRVRVVRSLHSRIASPKPIEPSSAPVPASSSSNASKLSSIHYDDKLPEIIAIGSSTGGPVVLRELLNSVVVECFPPVVIVQHLPPMFTRELAAQLDAMSSLTVVEASDGECIRKGRAYIVPGGTHMQVNSSGVLTIQDGPPINHCKPSVDVLFHSVAKYYGPRALALVLTGMGEDGAQGALAIKRAGGAVVAQNEASSIVFGMPAAAIKAGAVDEVLSLDAIKNLLCHVGTKMAQPNGSPPMTPSFIPKGQ